jgi:hypothetical protein
VPEILALIVIVGAALLVGWQDHVRRQALLRRQLEEQLRSQAERLKIIDTELRRVHGVLAELLEPIQMSMTPQDTERLKALDALRTAGWMASGLPYWPRQTPD